MKAMSLSCIIVLVFLLIFLHTIYVQAQSRPQLAFHFVANATSKNKSPDSRDVSLQPHLDYLLYGLMCKSPGNKFIIRISPSSGSTELVDEISGVHNNTEGVKSCLLTGINPIKCEHDSFCVMGNKCNATVLAVCQRHGKTSRWLMTQVVDVTMDQVDGSLVMVKCMTRCESPEAQEDHDHDEENGISYLAVGLIVAGVVLAASLVVIAVVVWKIRDTKYLEHPDHPHHIHHIHYVK